LGFQTLNNIWNFQDTAIETPLAISHSSEGCALHEVEIKFDKDTPIAVINFVLKVQT
jgi:hypothetical protein